MVFQGIEQNEAARWPFDVMAENPDTWVRITPEDYDYMLNVLPPIYFSGGFAVSEAYDDDPETGEPRYATVVQAGFKFYVRHLPKSRMAAEATALRDFLVPPAPAPAKEVQS
jgi:uncharacterized protein DUF1419